MKTNISETHVLWMQQAFSDDSLMMGRSSLHMYEPSELRSKQAVLDNEEHEEKT